MLGKLIKYEWKGTFKIGLLMLGLILGVTLLGEIYVHSPFWSMIFNERVEVEGIAALTWFTSGIGSFFLYVFMLVGVTYGTMIYLGVRFYRTMYTDEGYLTQTLPVRPHELLLSKLMVSGIWVLLIEVCIGVSLALLGFGMIHSVGEHVGLTMDPLEMIGDTFAIIGQEMGGGMVLYLVLMLLIMLIGPFMTMSNIFGAVTLGQLSRKHKGMMGIVAYLALNFAVSVFSMIISFVVSAAGLSMSTMGVSALSFNSGQISSLFTGVVVGTAMFFVAQYILKNKLNLE